MTADKMTDPPYCHQSTVQLCYNVGLHVYHHHAGNRMNEKNGVEVYRYFFEHMNILNS